MITADDIRAAIDVRLAEVAELQALMVALDAAPAPAQEVAQDPGDDPDMIALLRAIDADNPPADPWQVAAAERAVERAAETPEQRRERYTERLRLEVAAGLVHPSKPTSAPLVGRFR